MTGSNSRSFGIEKSEVDEKSTYISFIEKRLEETLEENKRYHTKYVEMREFAY